MSRPTRREPRNEPTQKDARPAPRLYLVSPPLEEAGDFAGPFEAALGAADVACALLTLATRDPAAIGRLLDELGPIARRHGAALLIDGDPALPLRLGADGAHVRRAGAALDAAVAALKPDGVVGVGGLRSRHDAMAAAENDIDYVMFGEPAPGGAAPAFDDTLERVGWWAEIFNVPCVGYAARLDDALPLAAAGADFVALGAALWEDPRGAATAARAAEDRLRAAMETA